VPREPLDLLPRHDVVGPDGRALHVYGDLRGRPGVPSRTPSSPGLQQRLDILTGTWVAISPARNVRPDVRLDGGRPDACPLCPGGPEVPFSYDAAVFDNRFPALVAEPPPVPSDPLVAPARGRCEMVLYTERHEGSLATLTPLELARVIAIWRDRSSELWADPAHRFVLVFENHGQAVGATLAHPHGQIYAFDRVPPLVGRRIDVLRAFRTREGACAGCRVVAADGASARVISANPSFAIAVPFAPRWPFEVHVRARRHGLGRLAAMSPDEQRDLAAALRSVVVRYGALYGTDLPYMMVALEAPDTEEDWHLTVEFYPPHRSSDLTKIRASVETATGLFLNDTLPEESARLLAALPGSPTVEQAALRVGRVEP
jgi:UDPglucose--hexose-1-phosphate uridylyltransferase